MSVNKLKQFLDENEIKYVVITHSQAYSAQQIAATAHIPGKELAKTVMVIVDRKMVMAVLPASYKVDFDLLREALDAETIELADEVEFMDLFPGCEIGAMPPFGNLYDLEVYVADTLAEDEEIAFNAGSHKELVRMAYGDFERLVKPKVLKFAAHRT